MPSEYAARMPAVRQIFSSTARERGKLEVAVEQPDDSGAFRRREKILERIHRESGRLDMAQLGRRAADQRQRPHCVVRQGIAPRPRRLESRDDDCIGKAASAHFFDRM
jgi:hypothetical protein